MTETTAFVLALAALGVSLAGLVGAVAGLFKLWLDLRTVKHELNSRLSQLIKAKGKEQRAVGKEEGKAEQAAEAAEAPPATPPPTAPEEPG